MTILYWFALFLLPFYQLFSMQGSSSFPYLSGYTWGFFCDWRLIRGDYGSSSEQFNPELVQLGDTIFVDYSCLEEFARDYLPRIQHKVILVTANYGYEADNPMPGPFAYLLNENKVAVWFLQNIDREESEKLKAIPIGVASQHWPQGDTNLMDRMIPYSLGKNQKSIFIYLNFTPRPERRDCIDHFAKNGARFEPATKSFSAYMQDLSESIFVISPPGHGLDCHRTWEALLMGCYPVVKSSTLNPLYQNLPVVMIDDWAEVTQEFLEKKYSELSSRTWSRAPLYASYWFQRVRDVQKEIQKGTE